MDPLKLNQARQFIVRHLLVVHSFFGRDQLQEFYAFFKSELKDAPNPSWDSLQLLVTDHGRLFELLSALSSFEKSQLPCQFDLYHHPTASLCTRFTFVKANKALLERFLDHLSCFSALYLKDIEKDLPAGLLLLSQPVK
jgi:hypothetical protein